MNRSGVTSVTIAVDDAHSVRGLLLAPPSARACYVLAHGAGAGMFHPFMDGAARGLAERGIATLRYQFPYMERGANRPDPPELAHATVRAAVAEAARLAPALPLLAGGKTVPQLKRERSLRARFAEANGNYHNISNTWLVRGFPSSSPLTPAMQSGLCRPSQHQCLVAIQLLLLIHHTWLRNMAGRHGPMEGLSK